MWKAELVILAIVIVIVAVLARSVLAEPRPSFAVLMARVCANESSRVLRPTSDGGTDGGIDQDCKAMLQVVIDWSKWKRVSKEQSLRSLVPHVTGSRKVVGSRHALYASLPARGGDKPPLWDDSLHGPWSVYGSRWVRFRAAVAAMTAGEPERVCPKSVIAWGCDRDAHIAASRGLVEVDCGDTEQHYYALPETRAMSAAIASGK